MTTDLTISISRTAALTGLPRAAIKAILATLPDDPSVEQIVAAFVAAVRSGPQGPGVGGRGSVITGRDPNEPNMPRGIYSKSALSETFMLDRVTLTKRLRKAGIKPAYQEKKFVGFRLTDKGKGGLTVKQILEAEDDPKHTEAKIRGLLAQARVKELEYEEKSGSIREEIMREVRDELTKLFKALYTRMVKRYWRENSRRLRRCKTDVDLQRTGETDLALMFTELKRDYPEMFET
jgi:hypothetical protein